MRRVTKVIWVVIAALTVGACAAGIQKITLAPPVIEADLTPADELTIPQFEEDVAHLDTINALLGELPDLPTPCDIPNAIAELESRMLGTVLKVGTKEYRYTEVRSGNVSNFKDVEKQIALGLVNPLTCETYTTTVVKRGDKILTHESVVIEPFRRANGIRWNNWATEYSVTKPEGYTVVAVLYPYVQKGSARKIVPVFYTPYSPLLHTPQGVEQGLGYLSDLLASASDRLRALQVPSRAFPGTLVADHPLYAQLAKRLDANEHMDPGDFILDPRYTADRIHVVIGVNRGRTARYTCSSADACGIAQFTEPTYRDMRRLYPRAKLMSDTLEGRRDHLNVSMAQLLLMDSNMAAFIGAFGPEVADDPWVIEGEIAAYNTGAGRVINVRALALRKHITPWYEAKGSCSTLTRPKYKECILSETKWYLAKDEFLRDEWNVKEIAAP